MLSYSSFLNLIKHPLLLAFISGLLLALPQAVPWLWWMVFPGVALFIVSVSLSRNLQTVVAAGLLIGTLKSMGGYSWIWSTFPLTWVDIDSVWLQVVLMGAFWVVSSAFMGLGMIVPALVVRHIYPRTIVFILCFPIVWIVGEILGSYSVSLWFLGDGSFINGYIAHGYLGIPLAQLLLLSPVMTVAGVYGLTYITALLGALVALVSEKRKLATATLAIVITLLSLSFLIYPPRDSTPLGLNVLAIDTSFTSASQNTDSGRYEKREAVTQAIRSALQIHGSTYPDIILLPEDSRFTNQFSTPEEALQYLQSHAPEANTLLVDSARIDRDDGTAVLRAFYYDLEEGYIYMTDKQFLVPQGEYVTYPLRFLLNTLQPETMVRLNRNQNYVPGPLSSYEGFASEMPVIAFCYESSLTMGVFNLLKMHDTKLVLHPISHGKFNNPHILWYQIESLLRTQALWGRATIVTAGNMIDSRVYLPSGDMKTGEEVIRMPNWRLVRYAL